MKKIASIGFSLLLLAALPAAAGDAPTLQPLRLDGTPAGTCASPMDQAVQTSVGGGFNAQSTCSAEAQCQWSTVSCNGEGTCTAVDRNCSQGKRGYVECDGNRTYCPNSCCPCGPCYTIRWFQTEACCPNNLHVMEERRCTSSGWVNTGNTDCLVECGGGGPI